MSKKSRKIKWKGVALNHSNIDEYMKDLIEDTAGQYITQGVSFNKEDNFQMNLLKNSILAHGSFSGFVKNLLFAYFEKNGSIDDSVWKPNAIIEIEGDSSQKSPPPSPVVQPEPNPIVEDEDKGQKEDELDEQQENQDELDGTSEQLPSEAIIEEEEEEKDSENESSTPVKIPPIIKKAKRKNPSPNATAFLPKK